MPDLEKDKIRWQLRLNLSRAEDREIYEKIMGRDKKKHRAVADYLYAAVAAYEEKPAEQKLDYGEIARRVSAILEKKEEDENIKAILDMDEKKGAK